MGLNMKKKTMVSVLIAVVITAILVCIIGIIIKSAEPPPVTPPPKFEKVEIKIGDSAQVKGNLIKLISIEEEKGIIKIEVQNETTGEPMVVSFNFKKGGLGFNYKNMSIFPVKVEDNKTTFLIAEVAKINEE